MKIQFQVLSSATNSVICEFAMDGGEVTVEGNTTLVVDDEEDKDKVDKLVGIVARAASHLVIPPHSIKAQCNKGRVTFYPTLP